MRVAAGLAAASLAIAAAASVTACSAGSKAAGSAPAGAGATSAAGAAGATSAASAAGAASSAAGNSGSSGTTANFDVCTALTAAAASQITGTTFTTTKPGSVAGQIFSCEYGGTNSALLQISVTTVNGKDDYNADLSALKTVGFPPNPVTGVGDEAFSMPDPKTAGSVGASSFASYGAVFGDVYIKVGGLTYVTPDQGKQIVEELHGKL